MSDTTQTDVDDTDDTQPDGPKALREAAERGREATKRAEAMEREMAFLKAGIDTDTPVGKMFAKAYDGELDREQITEAAKAVGALGQAAGSGAPAPDEVAQRGTAADDERDQTSARQTAAGEGAAPPETPTQNPHEVGLEGFEENMKSGMTRQDASAIYFQTMMDSAAKGDERAIVRTQPVE
jgi:hypothetical protein